MEPIEDVTTQVLSSIKSISFKQYFLLAFNQFSLANFMFSRKQKEIKKPVSLINMIENELARRQQNCNNQKALESCERTILRDNFYFEKIWLMQWKCLGCYTIRPIAIIQLSRFICKLELQRVL